MVTFLQIKIKRTHGIYSSKDSLSLGEQDDSSIYYVHRRNYFKRYEILYYPGYQTSLVGPYTTNEVEVQSSLPETMEL